MPTTTELTEKYLAEHPSIKDCLREGVINYSKLSRKIAKDLNLDTTAFNECLNSGSKKSKVKADIKEGKKRQVNATPSFFVNGELVMWNSAEKFEAYLRSLQ